VVECFSPMMLLHSCNGAFESTMNYTAVNSMSIDMSATHEVIAKRMAAAAHPERGLLSGHNVTGEVRPNSPMELYVSKKGTTRREKYTQKIGRNLADVIAASERDNRGYGDNAGTNQPPALSPGVVISQAEAILLGDK